MTVGFTGTRFGMSTEQKTKVYEFLNSHQIDLAIHGDCIGADAEFDELCRVMGIKRVKYPGYSLRNPTDFSFQAHCNTELIHPALSHFVRNRKIVIVKDCDILLACPFSKMKRGGTWFTINFALQHKKRICIFENNHGRSEI